MRRKPIYLLPLAALVPLLARAEPPPSPDSLPPTVYLFSSFRDNGQDGLHLAYSTDARHFTPLNHDRPLLKPTVGKERLMRDPMVLRAPDGTFHVVWTCSWKDRAIGYAHSKDLIHWSEERALPVMEHEPAALNCWAPELAYDEKENQFLIFWSTTIPGRFPETDPTGDKAGTKSKYNHRIYSTTTKDFQTFTPVKLFFDPGYDVIDATLLKRNDQYVLIYKNETPLPEPKKDLHYATSDSVYGPYTRPTAAPFTEHWVEGPTAAQLGDKTIVYYDCYTRHRYGATESTDLQHWTDISDRIAFPKGTKHGTIFAVPKQIVIPLLNLDNASTVPAERKN